MYSVLQALGAIYRWEGSCKQASGETDEVFYARVLKMRSKHVAPLLDKIDCLVMELAKTYVRFDEKRKRWEGVTNTAIDKAVTFWLNNQEDLRLFLSVPQIAPDSNNVERAIRAVTLYRTSAFFKQSEDGARAFCNALTLRETADVNGIKDAHEWLLSFHRTFYEHVERRALTERYARLEKGVDGLPVDVDQLALKIKKPDPYYYRDFDFTPWLAWNYAKG